MVDLSIETLDAVMVRLNKHLKVARDGDPDRVPGLEAAVRVIAQMRIKARRT